MAAIAPLREGIALLRDGKAEEARSSFLAALRRDPNLVPAWVDLAAADIETCRKRHAIFAALVARILDPGEVMAATNLRLAARLECPGEDRLLDPAERAEAEIPSRQEDPAAWARAASLRRRGGARRLAAFLEFRALEAGGDREGILRRAAGDLEAAGLVRAARELLAGLPGEEDRRRAALLSRRLAGVTGPARDIARETAPRVGLRDPEEIDGLARIAEVLLLRGEDPAAARRELTRLLGAGQHPVVSAPFGRVRLPGGWTAVAPGEGPGRPVLLLRRFPGDTQVAFWPWRAPEDADLGAALAARLPDLAAVPAGSAGACPEAAGRGPLACRLVHLEADLGPSGRDVLEARVLAPGPGRGGVAVLVLAGDAGLGKDGLAEARQAVDALLAGIEFAPGDRLDSWARSADDGSPWRWPHPAAWRPLRQFREAQDPWRTFPAGNRLVVDLPPGVVAGPVSGGMRDERCGPFTRLWFRGNFVDLEGREVSLGGPDWAGHVDVRPGEGGRLAGAAERPADMVPAQDPGARLVGSADLGSALRLARTGMAGRVARFAGDSFPGTWFVAWVRVGDDLVVVEEPVRRGERSLSLLWIPVTVRPPDNPGPRPPVDVAARWRIRFLPAGGREERADPREGILVMGPLEVALPRGFRASMRASSPDGFPVIARGREGATLRIDRLAPSLRAATDTRERLAEVRLGGRPPGGWTTARKRRGSRILAASWPGADRAAWLVLPPDPARDPAFLLVLQGGHPVDRGRFREWARLVGSSIRWRARRRR